MVTDKQTNKQTNTHTHAGRWSVNVVHSIKVTEVSNIFISLNEIINH